MAMKVQKSIQEGAYRIGELRPMQFRKLGAPPLV